MHLLIIQTGKHKGKKLKLAEAQVVVGRDEDCRIKIASSDVSRQHALLIPVEDGVLVRDLGSRNGTFVDGVPIQGEVLLRPGGTLSVGPLTFELSGGDGRKAPMGARPAAKKANDPKLSDDDIASWLAEEGALLSSDTTIVSGSTPSSDSSGLRLAAPAPSSGPPPAPPRKKKEFRSVAEEAADIIRRHREALEASADAPT
ncbi:FHA domain-containing protein [Planctomyces sp. SH-PL14]|uniref:FHA domain-containing protein n=1 Tax=Planctomyces sp. SH-PL14 TaxID=1632864 RepID=UPI00078C642A|nr:FHA domain-containing protein [Planctomyces sp. SH-PL14]AMV21894.1 FHA domain protein [Planctomyces sp. SH-PL14]